jgi:hypothetical protein
MSVEATSVVLTVDAAAAQYPITLDPVIHQTILWPSSMTVAMSGDTFVADATNEWQGYGAVYVATVAPEVSLPAISEVLTTRTSVDAVKASVDSRVSQATADAILAGAGRRPAHRQLLSAGGAARRPRSAAAHRRRADRRGARRRLTK